MAKEAKHHKPRDFYCRDPNCKFVDLHLRIPRLSQGLRNGKNYVFFAHFAHNERLVWQGFLNDYDSLSDGDSPMDDLRRGPNGELNDIADVLGAEGGLLWDKRAQDVFSYADNKVHFKTGNISNLKRQHLNPDLRVTLVSLIHSREPSALQPELRLHYSSQGEPKVSSPTHDSPAFDILHEQRVTRFRVKNDDDSTPVFIWMSESCLYSVSLLYTFGDDNDSFADRDYYDDWDNDGWNDNDYMYPWDDDDDYWD
jgi:hypothetical protein